METKNKYPFSNQDPLLTTIVDALNQLNQKVASLVDLSTKILKTNEMILEKVTINEFSGESEPSLDPDAIALLSLPMSLRKTVMILYRLERATADDLARETGRLRAVESSCANQLVRMGYLKKSREGRDVYFYIDQPEETNHEG